MRRMRLRDKYLWIRTHTQNMQYLLLFSLQQWLLERASMLHNMNLIFIGPCIIVITVE